MKRVGQMVLAGVCALVLAGCSSTVAGVALKVTGPAGSDDAVVALMDTGNYQTTPSHPFGRNGKADGFFEAHRMADYVVGPWQVDSALHGYHEAETFWDSPVSLDQLVEPEGNILSTHGFIAGFSTFRVKLGPYSDSRASALQIEVLRFPDADLAITTAKEIATNVPRQYDDVDIPVPIPDHPEAIARARRFGTTEFAESFSSHGPYVLYIYAETVDDIDPVVAARRLIFKAISQQELMIDQFPPTDPAKLAAMPKDPTGRLLASTLTAKDGDLPGFSVGVWGPKAWLHFMDNPEAAETLFDDVGVTWVVQRLATVYETRNRAGAAQVVDWFTAEMSATPFVKPIGEVSGLPGAKCFERTEDASTAVDQKQTQFYKWHFKCVARADRYAFTTFSDNATDVKQQISAQYRILAGK